MKIRFIFLYYFILTILYIMRTQLVFFGSEKDSIEGTKRGFIAFVTLIILDMIWFKFMDYSSVVTKKKMNIYSALFVWLLLCSAIGVQENPKDYKESLVYGMLVGLVVYGVYNGTNYAIMENWTREIAIMDTLWGVFVCGAASLAVYFLYHRKRNNG